MATVYVFEVRGIDCTDERRHRFHPPCRFLVEYGDARIAPTLFCAPAYEPIADWSPRKRYDARILGIQPLVHALTAH